jgi:hypothetical protein
MSWLLYFVVGLLIVGLLLAAVGLLITMSVNGAHEDESNQ